MFKPEHITKLRTILKTGLTKMVAERAKILEESYKKNPYVANAKVKVNGEKVTISIKLNFVTKDDKQDIPWVLEYGGVIFDAEKKPRMVEPGFYFRRIMAQGATE